MKNLIKLLYFKLQLFKHKWVEGRCKHLCSLCEFKHRCHYELSCDFENKNK